MKNKTCLLYSSAGTRPIYFTPSLFSHSIFLCYFYARVSRFSSPSLLYRFETKQYTRDTYAGTEEPIKPNYSCIRHRSSSFFYTMCIYIFLFIVRASLWTLIREIKWSTSLSFFRRSFINKDRRRMKFNSNLKTNFLTIQKIIII